MAEAVTEKQTGAENIIWDLTVFYNGIDDPKIEADLEEIQHLAGDFEHRYRGQVAKMDAKAFVAAYEALEAIYEKMGAVGSFARLSFSTDTNNPQIGALVQRITEFDAEIEQQLVFFDLEWNKLDDDAAQKILDDPAIEKYRYVLESARRFKPYQLSEAEEQLLIDKNVTGNSAWNRFFTQLTSGMLFDFEGEKLPMAQLLSKVKDPDREVRRKTADSMTAGLRDKQMELTFVFNVLAADKASNDKRRGYESWITSRNLSNKAPDAVVEALIETVVANYGLVARHYNLKHVLTGYDELYDYDRYAPLPLKGSDRFYTWDDAQRIVQEAYSAFSPDLAAESAQFFDKNWIHAPVMQGKQGGAFAHPTVPSVHPFVMTNYTGTTSDVMTLAHELGHGVHMSLSGKKSGLFALYTPLTTAETASVFGEILVFKNLMANEPDKEIQLGMLADKLEGIFATVFRQIAMNRFEDAMHTARRTEGELSTDRLSEIWMETQQAMFGDSVTLRDDYAIWWSYIPHFLGTPGYVYAYAFGELLTLALYKLYESEGASFVPKYLDLLAAGDSDYPDKLLAKIGVDLNDPGFWQLGIDVIGEMVAEEEALVKELFPDKA